MNPPDSPGSMGAKLPPRRPLRKVAVAPSRPHVQKQKQKDAPNWDDPFAKPLDEEMEPPRGLQRQKEKAVSKYDISHASDSHLVSASGAPLLHESLLQCPFCRSVFRSGVAGKLVLCPVCVAMGSAAESTKGESKPPSSEPAPRFNRSGIELPLDARHSLRYRSNTAPDIYEKDNADDAPAANRSNRHGWLIVAIMAVIGTAVFAALLKAGWIALPLRDAPANTTTPGPINQTSPQSPLHELPFLRTAP